MSLREIQDLVAALRSELVPVYSGNAALYRVWLELEWIDKSISGGSLSLPSTWESSIYSALVNGEFEQLPAAQAAAVQLKRALGAYVDWNFTFKELSECSGTLRTLGTQARSMEEVAQAIVDYLYDHLINQATGERVCALVRLFKTHPYKDLEPGQQAIVCNLLKFQPEPGTRCLTLLATRGKQAQWNSRQQSRGHQVIPLTSEEMVRQLPMVSRLLDQLGVQVAPLVHCGDRILLDPRQSEYGVLYIEEAENSPHIPVQSEFVRAEGIRSVVGLGGPLPSGEMFVIMLFFTVHLGKRAASLFRTVASSAELGLVPFDSKQIFRPVEQNVI